jgi:hypothetical protein
MLNGIEVDLLDLAMLLAFGIVGFGLYRLAKNRLK